MKRILFLVLLLVATTGVYGQKFAVKSNLLYDATATINLGVEVGLAKKWSLDLSGNYNGWKFGDEARMKHWLVQPEARYWLCEKFNGFLRIACALCGLQCWRSEVLEQEYGESSVSR